MPIFKAGDVVRVPSPYVEAETREMRPALVISAAPIGPDASLIWALMITSTANRGWQGDVSLEDNHAACGLPIPSVIRTEKVAVLETRSAGRLGCITPDQLAEVMAKVGGHLGIGHAL